MQRFKRGTKLHKPYEEARQCAQRIMTDHGLSSRDLVEIFGGVTFTVCNGHEDLTTMEEVFQQFIEDNRSDRAD